MGEKRMFDIDLFQQRVGGLSSFRKAALVFLDLLPQWTAQVQQAVERRDWESVLFSAHQMKGCSSMLCAHAVHDQLRSLEVCLTQRAEAEALAAIQALLGLLEAAETELRSVWLQEA